MSNPKIVLSPFCANRDQRLCRVNLLAIVVEVVANFSRAKAGYRAGVVLVPVSPENFIASVVNLKEGDPLVGSCRRRQEGELPRQEIRFDGEKEEQRPGAVDVVLYHNSVLAEGGENSDPTADYEIIAILTKLTTEEQPMNPSTLMANHFLDDGGTTTQMGDVEFVDALKKSYFYWRDKAVVL